jgi:hypothetical protein
MKHKHNWQLHQHGFDTNYKTGEIIATFICECGIMKHIKLKDEQKLGELK